MREVKRKSERKKKRAKEADGADWDARPAALAEGVKTGGEIHSRHYCDP